MCYGSYKAAAEDLKALCESHLCQNLSVVKASARLVLSDQVRAKELKEACLGFIRGNAAEVMMPIE
jgi:hypothetical protein